VAPRLQSLQHQNLYTTTDLRKGLDLHQVGLLAPGRLTPNRVGPLSGHEL
jgi:hypothetical protein